MRGGSEIKKITLQHQKVCFIGCEEIVYLWVKLDPDYRQKIYKEQN